MHRPDPLHDGGEVVVDVAEVLLEILVDDLEGLRGEGVERSEQRSQRVLHAEDVAHQDVDLFDGIPTADPGEHRSFHLTHVPLEAVHDRLVVVHDMVDDGVQHRSRSAGEPFR